MQLMHILIQYYYKENVRIPEEVLAETNTYIDENNPIKQFIEENIEQDESSILLKRDIKLMYKEKFSKSYRWSDFIKCIEYELGAEFQRNYRRDGEKYNDVLVGYTLKDEYVIEE